MCRMQHRYTNVTFQYTIYSLCKILKQVQNDRACVCHYGDQRQLKKVVIPALVQNDNL